MAAELPVGPPPRSYPTAVRGQLDDDASPPAVTAAKPAASATPPATADTHSPTEPPVPGTKAPAAQRVERPQPLVTPLAVIPSQYVRSATPAPQPAAGSPPPAMSPGAISQSPAIAAELTAAVPAELVSGIGAPRSMWPPPAAPLGADASSLLRSLAVSAEQAQPLAAAPSVGTQYAAATAAQVASVSPPPAPSEPSRQDAAQDAAARQTRIEQARRAWIETLEDDIRLRRSANASDEELPRLEQQLRLLYLAADRFDEAVEAVSSLETQPSEAYKHVMFALGVWLSPDEARRASLRSAKVLRSLRDATAELATASKLEVRKVAFCERVDYFGWYNEFPRNEFRPKQEVILYAEVDNFTAEQKGPAAFETELQGQYEIFDASGQSVASRQLQLDKETCRNYRRDYYLAYKIYIPDNLSPGRYRLELTIEDLKARGAYQGRKLGDGVIEFTIK